MISVYCPACGLTLEVADYTVDQPVRCSQCKTYMRTAVVLAAEEAKQSLPSGRPTSFWGWPLIAVIGTTLGLAIWFAASNRGPSAEDIRKQIFFEQSEAYRRAQRESDEKFGVYTGRNATFEQLRRFNAVGREHGDYSAALARQYIDEVAKKYNLTTEQLSDIAAEGGQKQWPHPSDY